MACHHRKREGYNRCHGLQGGDDKCWLVPCPKGAGKCFIRNSMLNQRESNTRHHPPMPVLSTPACASGFEETSDDNSTDTHEQCLQSTWRERDEGDICADSTDGATGVKDEEFPEQSQEKAAHIPMLP